MSFGLSRGKQLDPGQVGINAEDLPPLPDDIAVNRDGARLDPRAWFPHPERPFEIEIGSGKGTFLVQQAELQPETNFLGMEWAGEFFGYAADRIRRRGLLNVRMLRVDATEFLQWRVASGIARVIHLYFSDPWPKARHHRRRVVQDRFLMDAHRVLIPGGELRIVTDHAEYWAWMEEHFARWCGEGWRAAGLESGAGARGGSPLPNPPPEGEGAGSASGLGMVACEGGARLRFERLLFEKPESAGEDELVGTNFERKYAKEGRVFRSAKLKKI